MSIILRCMLLLLVFWQGVAEAADDPDALYNRVYETRAVAYEKLGNLILASSDINKAKLLNEENRAIVVNYSSRLVR